MLMNQIAPQNEATVKNLMTAFESESNAHGKYLAYAEKADAGGLHHAAGLLRAIARSEQIHANNHARVIRQLGGDPQSQIQLVEIKETLDNLRWAMKSTQSKQCIRVLSRKTGVPATPLRAPLPGPWRRKRRTHVCCDKRSSG
jgi:rubrerythrin